MTITLRKVRLLLAVAAARRTLGFQTHTNLDKLSYKYLNKWPYLLFCLRFKSAKLSTEATSAEAPFMSTPARMTVSSKCTRTACTSHRVRQGQH